MKWRTYFSSCADMGRCPRQTQQIRVVILRQCSSISVHGLHISLPVRIHKAANEMQDLTMSSGTPAMGRKSATSSSRESPLFSSSATCACVTSSMSAMRLALTDGVLGVCAAAKGEAVTSALLGGGTFASSASPCAGWLAVIAGILCGSVTDWHTSCGLVCSNKHDCSVAEMIASKE